MAQTLRKSDKAQETFYLRTGTMVTPDAQRKRAMRRLLQDQQELRQSPVSNVSAEPLDSDIFEWHCNIRQDDAIYHMVLFLPHNYPYDSPSAEFLPTGFLFSGGATMTGTKGIKVCLNIFSDFAKHHSTEWTNEKGYGWSPGYTVQTVLMNLVAFLAETAGEHQKTANASLSKSFTCKDCGHTYSKPFPALDFEQETSVKGKDGILPNEECKKLTDRCLEIVDYISKENFILKQFESQTELFGYGLAVSGPEHRPSLTTPCEFMTAESFYGMQASMGFVHSTLKEKLMFFLPLYIHPLHGNKIQETFEETIKEVAKILPSVHSKTPFEEAVLKTIPNLMAATVVEFSKGTQHTSDNSLTGYFALHRLLLWALETYPSLQGLVDMKLKDFIEDEDKRTKSACPHIGEWLMLLSSSEKYTWEDASEAYLNESFRRNVMWYVKDDSNLGFMDTDMEYRLLHTFRRTEVSRKILAFQVLFLDIAQPSSMSRKDLVHRYDQNYGFPTEEMVKKMKEACYTINNSMNSYQDWFKVLNLEPWDEKATFEKLVESLKYSIETKDYHWTLPKTAGGWTVVLKKYQAEVKAKKAPEAKERIKDGKAGVNEESPKTWAGKGKGRGKRSKGVDDLEFEESEEERADRLESPGKRQKEDEKRKGRGRGRKQGQGAKSATLRARSHEKGRSPIVRKKNKD